MVVEWDDGTTLSQSHEAPGHYSPLTRDGERHLAGHAVLRDPEPDEHELYEDPSVPPSGLYDAATDRTADDADTDLAEEAAHVLAALAVLGAALAAAKASPYVARWWRTRVVPVLHTAHARVRSRLHLATPEPTSDRTAAVDVAQQLEQPAEGEGSDLEPMRPTMSRAEADRRLAAALAAQNFSREQLRILQTVRIADDSDTLEVEGAAVPVTPDLIAAQMAPMLESRAALLDDRALAALGTSVVRMRTDEATVEVPLQEIVASLRRLRDRLEPGP